MLTSVEPSFTLVLSLWSYRLLQHSPKVCLQDPRWSFLTPTSDILDKWAPVPHEWEQRAGWKGIGILSLLACHPGTAGDILQPYIMMGLKAGSL